MVVNNPDVSQAFYGELKGHAVYYLIELKEEQNLYLSLLVPDLPAAVKDKTAEVSFMSEPGARAVFFAKLEAAPEEWKKYHEEFAGDDYWQGPEMKRSAQAGYYLVKISGADDYGKYVLVAGEKEEWPAVEAAKAAVTIPWLKKDFFNEPVTAWFNGKIGRYFLYGLVGLLILIFLIRKFNQAVK